MSQAALTPPPAAVEPILAFDRVTVAFDGPPVLDQISFTLQPGETRVLLGPAGVGKSVLLGDIAVSSDAAVNVVALIGERGREVREFIEHDLGPDGLARSVVVVAAMSCTMTL